MSISIPQINITQTFPRIAINTSNSGVVAEQRNAKLQVIQHAPQIQMERDQTFQVIIDQSQCFIESGIKPVSYAVKEFAQRGTQNAYSYIDNAVSEGHALANSIGNKGGNTIANLAKNVYPTDFTSPTIKLMPQSRPNISSTGGHQSISFTPAPAEFNITPSSVDIIVTPASVSTYVAQEGSVQITV